MRIKPVAVFTDDISAHVVRVDFKILTEQEADSLFSRPAAWLDLVNGFNWRNFGCGGFYGVVFSTEGGIPGMPLGQTEAPAAR